MFIMWFLLVQLIAQGTHALSATQSSPSCSHDDLFTSLSRDGRDFCSSMVNTHCEALSTPTQFTSLPSARISSYCECIVTSCTEEVTSRTGTGQEHVTGTSKRGSDTSATATFDRQTRSSDDGNGSGQPTATDGSSSGMAQSSSSDDGGSTKLSSVQTSVVSVTLTDHVTISSAGSGVSQGSLSDTGSVTGKDTQTSRGASKETTTSLLSDPGSINATATGSRVLTSSALSRNGSSTAPSGTRPATGGSDPSQSSKSVSGSSVPVPPGLNTTTSTAVSDAAPSPPADSNSTTQAYTSGNISPAPTGWNLSATVPSGATGSRGVPPITLTVATSATTALGSSPGSVSTATAPGARNITTVAPTASPPFITPPGFNTSTLSNATQTTLPIISFANFTQVTRTAALAVPTCYQMRQPEGAGTRRALLHNANLREQNANIPFPYIESVNFKLDGVDPLYLTLRDATGGTHYIDVSNRSYIAIVDSLHNVMLLDANGIHFSTKNCEYDISITIDSMYEQLARLSGQKCSAGVQRKRMNDKAFSQTLYLRDQCNNPVKKTVRKYPQLKVGDTDCNDIEVDESTGRWLFDCTFPGSDSGALKCQWAVKNDIEEFLFRDPFGGACPDISTVITTLEANGRGFINMESLRVELYNQGLNETQKGEADLTVIYYEHLWEILQQAFSKLRTQPPGKAGAIQEYIDMYNQYRNFEDDICEDLHADDMPLNMSLNAGVTYADAIAKLNWAPENPQPFSVTIQDPAQIACCPGGGVAATNNTTGVCAYPLSARVGDTGCVCGRTAAGAAVAFEVVECENFVSECQADGDCAKAGHARFVCLTGSCCGGGVCVDPYECAQNGTSLVRTRLI